jgi:hypothetical protein
MPYKDVCVCGNPAGGRVREDDPHGSDPRTHDAGGISPGLQKFLDEVVSATPAINVPPKPLNFPPNVRMDTYPGRSAVDVHFEGRAADIFFSYVDPAQRVFGDWLFDWCVANCTIYKVQGVIFGKRKWFSELNQGKVNNDYKAGDHNDHVHVELNCDGANLRP